MNEITISTAINWTNAYSNNKNAIVDILAFYNLSMNETEVRSRDDHEEIENWPWTKILLIVLFCLLIVVTVIGNTLVILSVITTRRLRTVTNCFVMSLAVADWLVGIFVMPPAVFVFSVGKILSL